MNESFRAFKVIIPPNHPTPDEAAVALRTCTDTHGIELVERPPETFISPTQLEEISYQRWRTIGYGCFAAAQLQSLQQRSVGRVIAESEPDALYILLPHYGLTWETACIGPRNMTDRQIDNAVHALLSTVVSPFPFLINGSEGIRRSIQPCAPTQPRLARYLGARGLSQHSLHGLLGKGLDVWSVAAGVEPATKPAGREWRGPYMSNATLREKMLNAGLSSSQISHLQKKIQGLLSDQWYRGVARAHGEIIVDYDNPDAIPEDPLAWQLIACSSFAPLAKAYDNESPVIAFLEKLAKNPQ